MMQTARRVSRSGVYALLALMFVLACSVLIGAEGAEHSEPWFDPTQLPSFSGTVDRYLPNPDGHVDRLVFKEGPQIAFPPDAFESVRQIAAKGHQLVVWGIRARRAAVITMLAFAAPEGKPIVLDRFYWRPESANGHGRHRMLLIGRVWTPYLSPQGDVAGAVLENGDVVRVEPEAAAGVKERLKAGAKIVAEGVGADTAFGKAIDATRIGDTIAALEPVRDPGNRHDPENRRPVPAQENAGTSRPGN